MDFVSPSSSVIVISSWWCWNERVSKNFVMGGTKETLKKRKWELSECDCYFIQKAAVVEYSALGTQYERSHTLLKLEQKENFLLFLSRNSHQHSFPIMEMLSSMDSVLVNIDKIQLNHDKIEVGEVERHQDRINSGVLHSGFVSLHLLAPRPVLWI